MSRKRLQAVRLLLAASMMCLLCGAGWGDRDKIWKFDIPRQNVSTALSALAQQTGTQLLFPYDEVSSQEANPLAGRYTLDEALEIMLRGTGLAGGVTGSGVITISLETWAQRQDQGDDMERERTRGILAGVASAVLSVFSGQNATAQETAEAQTTSSTPILEEVTVYGRKIGQVPGSTATKTGTPLLETPFTVNVVSRELLDLRSVSNIGSAVETVSGVSRTIGFSGNQRYRIRAFQAISYLRDGFRQSISQPEVDLQGVDSVEVLKGPASALYGRFEPGGVVNFVSKRPLTDFGMDLSLTGGSYDYARLGLDVTGALNQGATVAGRLNVAYENADSFRDLVDNEQLFVAPSIEFRPDDATTVLFRAEYLDRDMAFDRGLGNDPIFLTVPISRNYGEEFMRQRKEQWVGSVVVSRELSEDWRLRVGGYYSRVKVPEEEFFNYGFPAAVSGTTVNRNFSSFKEQQDDRTLQAELYGRARTGALTHRLLFGIEHTKDELQFFDAKAIFGAPGVDLHNPVRTGRPDDSAYFFEGDSVTDLRTNAVYAQNEISWDRWRLLLGGRYEETKTYAFAESFRNPAVTRKDRPFSPRAGLTFLPTPNVSLYVSWAESFRNEGGGSLLRNGIVPEPTRGEQLEAGAKVILLGNRLEASLAAYDLAKTNVIVGDPQDFRFALQIGELVSRGIEAEVSARPLDPWTIVAAYGYADTEIARDTNTFILGNRMAGVPEHQASLWTSWQFEEGALEGLTVGGGLFYSGEQAATNTNTYFLPSYLRVDLNAAYRFGDGYEIRANLDNLTDEKIYITGGFSQIYPQAPRSLRLTVSKRWGAN